MKRANWPVGDYAIRPISSEEDVCTYCRQPRGSEHLANCVIRQRTIVVRAVIEYVTTTVEDNDEEKILFHYNEGTHCADNDIEQLHELVERINSADEDFTGSRCMCSHVRHEFVREATEWDEKVLGVWVADVPS
jgi:hypothetical protein